MNLDYVAHRLKEVGWRQAHGPVYFGGERFDLQFSRLVRTEPWMIMVQAVPVLDFFTLMKFQTELEWIFSLARGKLWQRNLLFYFVAGKTTQQALHALKMDQLNLKRFSKKGSGTRKIMVVDEAVPQVEGPFPPMMPYEKEPPFDLTHIFMRALAPDGVAFPAPAIHDDAATLIDRLLPASALKLIGDSNRSDLSAYRVEALTELGCLKQAEEALDELLPRLQGDERCRLQRFKARYLFNKAQVDEGIWMLDEAAGNARSPYIRAAIISTKANGYAIKRCFHLAEEAIREALQVAPDEPRVAFAQATLYMQMDRRLEARDVLERMQCDSHAWVNSYIDLELANLALLLGEFDEAQRLAVSALDYSAEIINPLAPLTFLALLKGDISEAERLINQLETRSAQADSLPFMRAELTRLSKRLSGQLNSQASVNPTASAASAMANNSAHLPEAQVKPRQRRLESFPSLVQRRNHCGPSTIELVLRYWKGGLELTNTEIARRVMLPDSGTPIYQMTEFFHLVGFKTLRCIAPPEKLKQLVDANYPVIVEETGGGQAHVTVVIGYDDEAGTIELQDPMTHYVVPMPVNELNRLRSMVYDSAVVAFPAGRGHEVNLARLGLFPDEVLALLDQASLAMNQGNHALVSELLERAASLRPQHAAIWAYWLQDLIQQWHSALDHLRFLPDQADSQVEERTRSVLEAVRGQFLGVLARARSSLPDADFIFYYTGHAALLDGDLPHALATFQKTHDLSPHNPDVMAAIAECQYGLIQVEQALESAREAVRLDPGSIGGNVWLARCLSFLHRETAGYFARIGLELAPAWWMPHLTMAEIYIDTITHRAAKPEIPPAGVLNPAQAAWQELDTVLSRAPNQTEALVLRAYLMMTSQDYPSAQSELQLALAATSNKACSPMVLHEVYQAWCLFYANQGLLEPATIQVQKMLGKLPNDPWALAFQARMAFRQLLQAGHSASSTGTIEMDIGPVISLCQLAITANSAAPDIVSEYLGYMLQLGKRTEAIELARSLCESFPGQPNLLYHYASMLQMAGEKEKSANTMVEAISAENGIRDNNELSYAFYCILQARGPEGGEKAILDISLPKNITVQNRDRSLGLLLAGYPKDRGGRARLLLEAALAHNPEDPEAVFWLGSVPVNEEERETLLKRSIFLAPQWSYARMNLAGFLIDKGRYLDTLDITTGHEYESLDLLARHVYSLNRTGQFERSAPAADRLINDMTLPGNRPSLFYRMKVDADIRTGEYARALDTIRKAQALFPGEKDWYLQSCLTLCNLGQVGDAEAFLAVGKESGLEDSDLQEGQYWISVARNNLRASLEISRMAQEAYWKNLASLKDPAATMLVRWSNRYILLLAYHGQEAEAEKYLKTVFKDSRVCEITPVELSKVRLNQLTLDACERALEVKNITPSARYNALLAKALAYRNLDDTEARNSFEQLRGEFPLQSGPLEQLAIYATLEGDFNHAMLLAEHAVVRNRSIWSTWAVRGLVHLLKGESQSGQADLKSAWNRTDEHLWVGYPFWWLYSSLLGDIPSAKQWRDKANSQAESTFDHQLLDVVKSLILRRTS